MTQPLEIVREGVGDVDAGSGRGHECSCGVAIVMAGIARMLAPPPRNFRDEKGNGPRFRRRKRQGRRTVLSILSRRCHADDDDRRGPGDECECDDRNPSRHACGSSLHRPPRREEPVQLTTLI